MFWKSKVIYFSLSLLFLFSCAHEKAVKHKSLAELKNLSISIEMPKNILVFENISPVFYSALHDHFSRVGFNVGDFANPDFILKTEVKKLDTFGKIVSPDILSYGFNMKLEVLCRLFDGNNKRLKEKNIKVTQAVFKPSDPILSSNFYHRAYEILAKRVAIKMEQYLRSTFLEGKHDANR